MPKLNGELGLMGSENQIPINHGSSPYSPLQNVKYWGSIPNDWGRPIATHKFGPHAPILEQNQFNLDTPGIRAAPAMLKALVWPRRLCRDNMATSRKKNGICWIFTNHRDIHEDIMKYTVVGETKKSFVILQHSISQSCPFTSHLHFRYPLVN